jgi:transcriptional regulator with XRE-family HTH domain
MTNMTDHIREEVRVAMVRKHVTQTQLAERVGLSRQHVSHLLTGHRGKLPEAWQRLLDGLGLELTVRPKREA